ncbi:hypothetical protein KZ829_25645 [Actinoplanes hulinensis]|uniref:Uncharacterized protein n=1 Tax=Actinoplanes hulinensis TaxID=1144547 RepID=A0ABS7B841_9ACTN|nr:hypothetical protein [Actinoplanes hulinensis]MBW6437133.1 hypothetical protein [Actinoplanes hulinensis]
MTNIDGRDVKDIGSGYDADPGLSMSLRAEAYLDPKWLDLEQRAAGRAGVVLRR